jgi:hypothetical protein
METTAHFPFVLKEKNPDGEHLNEYTIIPKLQLVAKSVATPLDKKGHIVQTLLRKQF